MTKFGAAVVTLCAVTVPAVAAASSTTTHRVSSRAVCATPLAGFAQCQSLYVLNASGQPLVTPGPSGLSPDVIKSAYDWPTSLAAGTGETIAIVDAYNDPTVEADLGVFDSTFGLPSCTVANGCLTIENQSGGTNLPRTSDTWSLEISLDVQWAHAIAPGAKIVLVESTSNSFSSLTTAVVRASTQANYVSNSWDGKESQSELQFDGRFATPGVSYFVAAGDAGLPATWPSASPNVVSVGGTTLNFTNGVVSSETGWYLGGGGCSAYESANPAQLAYSGYAQVGCGGARATPDVSADADPQSGVAVYDGTTASGIAGWWTVGGTSVATPLWAARSAIAGVQVNATTLYTGALGINFRDVTTGNNGAPCLTGYDLCSGLGSWVGSTP